MVPSDAPPLSFAIVPGVGPAPVDHWRASWQQSYASSTARPDQQRIPAVSRASAPTALSAGLPILLACGSLRWRGRGRQRHPHGRGAHGLAAEGHRWLKVLLRAQASEEQSEGQPASGSHSSAKEEVLQQLRNVVDEGLSTDVVNAGFVSVVEADPDKGFICLRLEVSMFEDAIRAELKKIPWARSFEVHVMAPQGPPPTMPPPLPVPPALQKVKSIIAVSSCKGGVGKSAVAVNLAYELRKSGAKVGIFDCDIYGPSLPVMVKVPGPAEMEMYMDENEQKHIVPLVDPASGVKLVSFGYVGALAMMRGSIITSLIVQLLSQTDWGELDYLVLDMPPGTGDIHLTLAQTCKITAAVIVTTPQKLSIIDVERGISMFRKLGVPSLAVVQNMSYYTGLDGKRLFPFGKTTAGSELAEAFDIDHVFEIPIDSSVSAGGDTGVPFVSTSTGVPAQVMTELAGVVRTKVDDILAARAPRVVSPFEKAAVKEKV